jgi:choline dehydrogenase-like flavoprotein
MPITFHVSIAGITLILFRWNCWMLDYAYLTAPQVAMENKVLPYARGKGMGGSSMINFMVYTRGAAGDYDEWAKLVGSDDWSWDAALKRFHKVCCYKYKAIVRSNINPSCALVD